MQLVCIRYCNGKWIQRLPKTASQILWALDLHNCFNIKAGVREQQNPQAFSGRRRRTLVSHNIDSAGQALNQQLTGTNSEAYCCTNLIDVRLQREPGSRLQGLVNVDRKKGLHRPNLTCCCTLLEALGCLALFRQTPRQTLLSLRFSAKHKPEVSSR